MKLRYITPILLIIHLYGSCLAAELHKLHDNKLAEGEDRELPHATPIHCDSGTHKKVHVIATKTPDEVLTNSIFGKDQFTSGPIGSHQSPRPGHQSKFKFAEVKGSKVLYALEVDPSGESGYWLPQGGTIDIAHKPSAHEPHYVFTPDFTGCSWTVTPMKDGKLRLRHVEGGKEGPQFNNLSEEEKGGHTTYAMQYKDYGYVVETHRLISNVPAYAFMHYNGHHWTLHFQRDSGCKSTGGYTFNSEHLLTDMILSEPKTSYPAVSGSKSYDIP